MKKNTLLAIYLVFLSTLFFNTGSLISQGAIGDYVWIDTNENGIQDPGEPPLKYITVKLYKSNGEILYKTTTYDDGIYHFPIVPAGDYYLIFDPYYTYKAYDPTSHSGTLEDIDNSDMTGANGEYSTDIFTVENGDNIDYIDAGFIALGCEPSNDDACADLTDYDLTAGGELPDEQTNKCSFSFLYFNECDEKDQENAVFYTFTITEPYNGIKININPSGLEPIQGIVVGGISYPDDDFCHDDITLGNAQCIYLEETHIMEWHCLDEGTYQFRLSTSDANSGTYKISSELIIKNDYSRLHNFSCENAEELEIERTCSWNIFEDKTTKGACPGIFSLDNCYAGDGPTVWYKFKIPPAAKSLDIKVNNKFYDKFDFVVFNEENACSNDEGWCGSDGILSNLIDVNGEEGKYYYIAVINTENTNKEFNIYINIAVHPVNDSPCIYDDYPPYDLDTTGIHHGTTCCADGANNNGGFDLPNVICSTRADDNSVWYRAKFDQNSYGMKITVTDDDFLDFFAVEVFSGSENAICDNTATFLQAKCNELPETSISIVCQDLNDYIFIKVTSSEEEGECSNFTIKVEPIYEKNQADDCLEIEEAQTLSPITPDEVKIDNFCRCGTLEDTKPDMVIPEGCVEFTKNPTVWFKVEVDENASQLYSYVTTGGNWTPVWSVIYSGSGNCSNLVNASTDDYTFDCSSDVIPQSTPMITSVSEGSYYIVVSAQEGDTIDDSDFELCVATLKDFNNCIGPDLGCANDESLVFEIRDREFSGLEPNGPPYNGPFYPGEKLSVHMSFSYDATKYDNNWLQGFIPKFGCGWDVDSFDFTAYPPVGINRNAKWYPEDGDCPPQIMQDIPYLCTYTDKDGRLKLVNTLCEILPEGVSCSEGMKKYDLLPGGYFWVSEGASPDCDSDNCSPSRKYGIGSPKVDFSWDFTISIKEFKNIEEYNNCNDLQISFQIFSDGLTGCWENLEGDCIYEKPQFSPQWEVKYYTGKPISFEYEIDNNDCYGECNGSIHLTNITNGIEPYKYIWDNGMTTKDIDSLCPGNYNLTIVDAINDSITGSFVVTSPPEFVFDLNTTNESSNNSNDGTASLSVHGGTPPYEIIWSTGDTTVAIVNLSPGDYSVSVTDSLGCENLISFHIFKYECKEISIHTDISNVSCYGDCDGKISISDVDSIVYPVTYLWSTGDTSAMIDNLCPGLYIVTVNGSDNCQKSETFTIEQPDEIIINIDSVNEINVPFSGSIAIGIDNPDKYTYQWSGPCGFSSNNKDIDSLNCAGCYTLIVTDTFTNCQADTTICLTTVGTNYIFGKQNIYIYPNPAREYVIFDFSKTSIGKSNISIYDLSGKIVFNIVKEPKDKILKIDLYTLIHGLYIAKIEGEQMIYYKKIVLE